MTFDTLVTGIPPPGQVKILVRKEVGNPVDYFDKTFAEYQAGFSAKGNNNQLTIEPGINS